MGAVSPPTIRNEVTSESLSCYPFLILAVHGSLFQRGAMNNRRLVMVAIALSFKP
jgi:hypothetical protein